MKELRLPRHLFVVSAAIGLLVPLLARLPSLPWRGWEWFTDYLPGVLVFSVLNLIPATLLFGLGKASKRAVLAYWFALAALVAFLLWAHGTMNLRASSTAVFGLVLIPLYAVGAVVVGWGVGWLAQTVVKNERGRVWMTGIALTVAIAGGVATSLDESIPIARREARFPIVAVQEVPFTKRTVSACCPVGRINVLALGNFDAAPGNDIAVLGTTGLAVLHPTTYAVKSTTPFTHQGCDDCVHMYPYLVPDGKGSLLVATSAGLSDNRGRLLWGTKASGFSKTVPIHTSHGVLTFLVCHIHDRIDLHNLDGKVLWSIKLPAATVAVYRDANGQELPSAIAGCCGPRQLHVYDLSGKLAKSIPLPDWASNVQAIAWPSPGHLLIGDGRWVGVQDPDGRAVLSHVIQDTSFNPYHGPDGTAVHFDATKGPYLAVMSHGSSGYARSVLLVFDSQGHLVWQEEMNRLDSILAVPNATGNGEVLLVGGMDGIVEYSIVVTSAPTSTQLK
jgi:hypothetical protein